MSNTYKGWSNRETWIVNLWLNNDKENYELFRYIMENYSGDGARAAELKWSLENQIGPDCFENGLWLDMINESLERVNWLEVIRKN